MIDDFEGLVDGFEGLIGGVEKLFEFGVDFVITPGCCAELAVLSSPANGLSFAPLGDSFWTKNLAGFKKFVGILILVLVSV